MHAQQLASRQTDDEGDGSPPSGPPCRLRRSSSATARSLLLRDREAAAQPRRLWPAVRRHGCCFRPSTLAHVYPEPSAAPEMRESIDRRLVEHEQAGVVCFASVAVEICMPACSCASINLYPRGVGRERYAGVSPSCFLLVSRHASSPFAWRVCWEEESTLIITTIKPGITN